MIESLQEFTSSLPPLLQWLGVIAAGAIPFVESYLGSVVGIVAGLNPVVAVVAAIVGNIASMLLLVLGTHAVRGKVVRQGNEPSAKRRRLHRAFDKYGVAGVSLFGQTILPSQITSAALVSFGASKNAVILWQIVSIILWGIAFGILATLGVDLLSNR